MKTILLYLSLFFICMSIIFLSTAVRHNVQHMRLLNDRMNILENLYDL
jgi:cbb3-type cytochrome oxidase subunit 3